MIRLDGSIYVDCPPGRLFDLVADQVHQPRWDPATTTVRRLTDGPLAVGTRWAATSLHARIPTPVTIQIDELVPPTRMVTTTRWAGAAARDTVTLAAQATGTRVTWCRQVELVGLARALEPFVARVARHQRLTAWARLKGAAEQSTPVRAGEAPGRPA